MLEVKDLEVSYGKIKAVKGISFDVNEGEVVTLIGTNGAGKTTTLRTISGLLRPAAGSIVFQGKGQNHCLISSGSVQARQTNWGGTSTMRSKVKSNLSLKLVVICFLLGCGLLASGPCGALGLFGA